MIKITSIVPLDGQNRHCNSESSSSFPARWWLRRRFLPNNLQADTTIRLGYFLQDGHDYNISEIPLACPPFPRWRQQGHELMPQIPPCHFFIRQHEFVLSGALLISGCWPSFPISFSNWDSARITVNGVLQDRTKVTCPKCSFAKNIFEVLFLVNILFSTS